MGGTAEDVSPGYRPKLQFDADVEDYFVKVFGVEHFQRICQALTCPSSYACIRVNMLQTTRREVIAKLLELLEMDCSNSVYQKMGLNSQGHPMFAEMVSSQMGKTNKDALCFEHPLLKNTIIVQGSGPHQIDYSGEHGPFKEVVVSRKCAEAVLRGANVFVPGVLACSGHVEQGDVVAVSVAVEHLDGNGDWVVGVTRGTILFSEHGQAQLNDAERRNCYIGKGKALLSRTSMFRELQGVAVEMIDRVYSLPPLHGVLKGDIFLQNLPSIVTAMVLDPQPGEHILDMCAAPGGKSTAIAILMEDKGNIVAIDRSNNKVMDIRRLAEEMKLTCVHAYKLDALKAVQREIVQSEFVSTERSPIGETLKSMSEADMLAVSVADSITEGHGKSDHEGSESTFIPAEVDKGSGKKTVKAQYQSNGQARKEARKLRNGPGGAWKSEDHANNNQSKGFLPHSFDRVLLDPPCSALGLRPRLFSGEETIEGLRRHAIYQKRMLDQAVQLCRPGGIIVYSTCTINPGENEAVVRYALDTYSCLSLVPQNPKLGGPGLIGGQDDGVSYKKWLREEERHLVQRFDPSGPLDTIGFFIAKFQVEAS